MSFGENLPPVLGLTCLKSHNASVQGTTHFFSSITSFFSVKHWARHPSLTHESTLGPANTPLAAPAGSENELSPQRTATGTQRQPTWHLLGFPVSSILHKRVFRSESAAHLPTGRKEPRTHCTAFPNQPFDKIPHALTTSNVGTFLVSFSWQTPYLVWCISSNNHGFLESSDVMSCLCRQRL